MVAEILEPEAAGTLTHNLAELFARPLADRLLLVRQLAEQIGVLHARGRTHRDIRLDTITLDADLQAHLSAPFRRQRFGGDDTDLDACPPDLAGRESMELPDDLAVAARLLTDNHCTISPQRIDLYQLGSLLCRLVTGHSIREYMISPTVKNLVPLEVQPCLARAIGFDAETPFENCDAMIAGLDEAILAATTAKTPIALNDTLRSPAVAKSNAASETRRDLKAATSSPAAVSEELPFRQLGCFQVLTRIGSGGMGDVYKGYDALLDRVVALKVLPAEYARDEELIKRFQNEASAVARLNHPNLAPVYYTGADAGRYFFAMQYIEGESLAKLLEQEPRLPLERSLDILEQCLAGLEAAHNAGLIHRDIKPQNILIERDTGRAMLIDFGLVRRLQDGARLTAPGTVMGSVDYIAPEQAQGKAVNGKSDLYSVGVLMYQLLSGRLPFTGDTPAALLYQHVHAAPPSLREIAPHLPQALADIVEKLMNKDPGARYPTAAAVRADLRALDHTLLTGEVENTKAPISPKARRGKRRYGLVLATLTAIVAAVLVAITAKQGATPAQKTMPEVAQDSNAIIASTSNGKQPTDDSNPKTPAEPAVAAIVVGPGKDLPKGKWVDVMTPLDVDWDTVSGKWMRGRWDGLSGTWRQQGTDLTVERNDFQRIMLPVELEGSYDLKVDFTRVSPIKSVEILFPVGKRTCGLALSSWGERAHGLSLIDGKKPYEDNNPASFRPGNLVDRKRYTALISVALDGAKAKIDVSLDGRQIITWTGRQESIDCEPCFALRKPYRPALAGNDSDIVYYSAMVRAASGKARMAPPNVAPAIEPNDPRWVDLLKDVKPDRDAIQGRWLHEGGDVAIAPASQDEKFVRLMLPGQVEGNYDLAAEFTRAKGIDTVTFVLPVGSRQCNLHFSACAGQNGGIDQIDGQWIGNKYNPALRKPSGLVNGEKHKVIAQVRTSDGDAVIDTWLDGKPFVHWAGHQTALGSTKEWSLPERWRVGIGANQSAVTFHSVRMRPMTNGAAPTTNQ